MLYGMKLRVLKNPRGNWLWRYWIAWRGIPVGNYHDLPRLIQAYAPNRTFVDVGCMWGIDGEHAFLAEEAGATTVKGVDVSGPTPAFEAKRRARGSGVEFIRGDITDRRTIERVGATDVVLCAGVLYHHPSPFTVLAALRQVCGQTLILRTAAIPEVPGLPNAAVYYPLLTARDRERWNLRALGVGDQEGITGPFTAEGGYGNWFWGLTPSCLRSLVTTAGFRVTHTFTEPFAQTLICVPEGPGVGPPPDLRGDPHGVRA